MSAEDPNKLEPTKPRGVVRLNRRGVWALGIALVGISLAAILGLQSAQRRAREGESRVPPPAPASRWYEGQSDALQLLPTPAPTAPAPLAGVTALPVAPPSEVDRMAARREQAYLRALDAKALVADFQRLGSHGPELAATPGAAGPGLAGLGEFAKGLGAIQPGQGSETEDANLQKHKQDFLGLADHGEINEASTRPSVSPYEVKAGSVIPSVLIAGVNSDLPGEAIAQVRENVYDTVTGSRLIIPQGTRTIGTYDSQVAYGQSRVLIKWQRMIFPNGKSLAFKPAGPGADAMGIAGFEDQVNNHLVDLFGRAILLSVITAGVELSQRGFENRTSPAGGIGAGDIASASLGQNLGQVAIEVIRRGLNRQPTIIIRPGYRFNVVLTRDLVFATPYQSDVATGGTTP